jgi:hypothetical protein
VIAEMVSSALNNRIRANDPYKKINMNMLFCLFFKSFVGEKSENQLSIFIYLRNYLNHYNTG